MAKFSKAVVEEQQEEKSRLCRMPGCPLVGTNSDNNRGGGPWWCSYHYHNRDPRDFTTEELRELTRISLAYNNGRRDYGGERLELRHEMHERKINERKQCKS